MVTLKISDEVNRKLEEFLALLLLRKGIKIDKKKFVEKAILHTIQDKKFIGKLIKETPLDEDPAWVLLDKPKRWGIKDSSIRIDEHLYR